MDADLRNEIAEYVLESERAIELAEENSNKLKAELIACNGRIRNLEEMVLRQQQLLSPLEFQEKVQLRKQKRNDAYTRKTLGAAFGSSDCCEESPLFQAALGFTKGSQMQNHTVGENDKLIEVGCTAAVKRCGKEMRKKLLQQMITYMYDGEILRDIEVAIVCAFHS